MFEIKTLENSSLYEITTAFNSAFSDYFFPVFFTEEQIDKKIKSESGNFKYSVGVFKDQKLIAFILHSFETINNERIIYNGGTGVIPIYRGNNLTDKMYDFIIPRLKKEKIDKLKHEVLTMNEVAIKTYKKQGFEIKRELLVFKGKLNFKEVVNSIQPYKTIETKNPDWELLESFWDYEPTWQASKTLIIKEIENNKCCTILYQDELVGYVIYNEKERRILQIAVDKNHRNKGIGNLILNYLYDTEQREITFKNIDSRTPYFKDFLEKRGLKNFTNQYEMELNLTKQTIYK